jgi:hypothetical protein
MTSPELPDTLVGTRLPAGYERASLTDEEARNVEVVVALRFAPIVDRPSFHHPGAEPPSRTGLAALDARTRASGQKGRLVDALSNRVDEFLDIIAKGDRVWITFTVTGTHTGELYGFAPTGRTLSFLEFGVYRLADGKIAEAYYFGDELGVIDQLEQGAVEAGS